MEASGFMRTLTKLRHALSFGALVLVVMLAVPALSWAAGQSTVNLGTTSSFAVLAGETITNTGATTIGGSAGGNIGLYPGTSFTGSANVTHSGAVHLADTVAKKAKTDLVTAYDDAAGRTPVNIIATQLGETTVTPGVYASSSGEFNITGTLTLDGKGDPNPVFIFLTTSKLVSHSNSTVRLINGARPCRVFWKVGSSATLGTNSHFVGHIFALTSIAAQTGATVQGQLLARNGSVTLDHNTITNGICSTGSAIRIAKTAAPKSLTAGGGTVTYTYFVTNPGTVDLSDVSVTDDMISSVTYVSGDLNHDHLLQPSEVWVYTGKAKVNKTTTNTATATGSGPGAVVTDTTSTQVVVSTSGGGSSSETANGAELPKTAAPWYNLVLAGVVLTFIGALGWWRTTRKMHE
jgi:uncharacterized repeat protein (TIGR01451 family)